MNTLNANDLKVGGVSAIEAALQDELEIGISVRGEPRYVVMSTAQYEHLRECELEAAWLASQADRANGRIQKTSAAQHQLTMESRLRKPVAGVAVQQERTPYKVKSTKGGKEPATTATTTTKSRKSGKGR